MIIQNIARGIGILKDTQSVIAHNSIDGVDGAESVPDIGPFRGPTMLL